MSIFDVFTLLGGIAVFLFGMKIMGDSLEKLAGGKLERLLERLTSNRFKGVLLGAGVTAVIQASGATTVMLVGFVNSGIMKLSQAISVIMGANIGTTVTGWILSLSGIDSEDVFVQMLKPSSFGPVLAFIGFIMCVACKKGKNKDIGSIILGFGMLMVGMMTMQEAVSPLSKSEEFSQIILMFSNPALGVIAGAVLTAILQSSSAAVGVLQAIANATGSLTYSSAMPIIMGQNIGTCTTALFSSIGANKNAKRVALVHLLFNVIGTVLFLTVFYIVDIFVNFVFMDDTVTAFGIAVIHTIFNLVTTAVLLPFTKQLEKLTYVIIKEKPTDEDKKFELLDQRFLSTPSFAIDQCRTVSCRMADITRDTLLKSITLLTKYDKQIAAEVEKGEQTVDVYEDKIGTYLIQLSEKNLSTKDSKNISMLLHCISDFERISDHAVNIFESAREMHKKELEFSDKAKQELEIYSNAIIEIINTSFDSFENGNIVEARDVEPLEEVIDNLRNELKKRHVKRLRKGSCTIELGLVLSDLLTNFERVADHCSNIAVCLIQIQENNFDTHEYINELRKSEDENFTVKFKDYSKKYALPVKRG